MNRSVASKIARAALCLSVLPFAAVTLAACSAADTGSEETNTTGRVSMALTAVSGGTTYRLTSASFAIDGPTDTVLTSSADPSVTVLTAELATGNYTSTLQGGWVLERFNGVAFVPVQATLVSANPANFTIADGEVTNLVYQFNTDGTVVTIGTGFLSVSIEVTETAQGCTAFGDGCAAGEWCAPAAVGGGTQNICLPIGPLAAGAACDGTVPCGLNAVCASLGAAPQCVELCPLALAGNVCPASGNLCNGTVSPDFGACL
jgi:hypothetical protein